MGIALLLASLALLVTASVGGRAPVIAEVVVAAAASGLAFGTKFQMIVPVGAVALAAVALAPAGQRVRRTLWWGGTLVVTGGFWYLRNLFAVGNPLPSMSIEIGPLSLPSPPIRTEFSTVASHAFDDGVWSDTYWPGFDQGLGGLWWLLLGAVALGLVGAALKGPLARAVAFVAGLTLVGFVVSPAILGYGDDLIYFDAVVRYLLPGLVLGAVTLAVAAAAWGTRWAWVAVGVLSAALMAIQVDQSDWTEPIEQGFDTMIWEREALTALVLSAVGLALLAAVAAGLRRADRRGRLAIVAGLAALLVLASIPVRDRYLDGRYVDGVGIVRVLGLDWTEGLHDERIGFTGGPTQYPLYGPDLSNHVQYIGVEGDHGAWDRPQTCEAWRQAVNDGGYTLVVASERAFVPEPDVEMTWTGSDPNAVVVDEVGSTVIYRINGPLDPATCPGAAPDDPAEPTT